MNYASMIKHIQRLTTIKNLSTIHECIKKKKIQTSRKRHNNSENPGEQAT